MNLRFLDTFVWVARLGSFRLTAEKLSTTQAAISSRIAVLESELGVQLFLRDSRGVSLTAEGHRVLGYAERMLATQRELHEALGLPEEGIAPGTRWEDIPDTWTCPDCGVTKDDFEMVQV